jgi:zinc transporter ZupT
MIEGENAFVQALLGTLLTWAATALGAAFVFVLPSSMSQQRVNLVLDSGVGCCSLFCLNVLCYCT